MRLANAKLVIGVPLALIAAVPVVRGLLSS